MASARINADSHLRSVVKGISYRLLGTLFTTSLSFAMTGSTKTAILLGSAEVTIKVLLFWGHGRVWAKIEWGRYGREIYRYELPPPPVENAPPPSESSVVVASEGVVGHIAPALPRGLSRGA